MPAGKYHRFAGLNGRMLWQANPATDFRDMGMLSLLQLLFFVTKYRL